MTIESLKQQTFPFMNTEVLNEDYDDVESDINCFARAAISNKNFDAFRQESSDLLYSFCGT